MKALFIGRFQPFHNGHLDVITQLKKVGITKVIIGIGTHTKGRTLKDPFTYEERVALMTPVLETTGMRYAIYNIPDINDPPHYAAHVEKIVTEMDKNTILVSGNPYTYDCFNHKYWVFMPPEKETVHATQIREWIRNGSEWKKHMPKETASVLEKMSAGKLLKGLK
ncbi:adenylyltransferase/cytidyltransferase family protein [Candidatus Woesearchaeota archaeon]|nr:adenylyltransferase/cytidyltransferase family protein [Candidatus Woesearchaeota archaeon]